MYLVSSLLVGPARGVGLGGDLLEVGVSTVSTTAVSIWLIYNGVLVMIVRLDDAYQHEKHPWGTKLTHLVRETIDLLKPGTVLDLGGGDGKTPRI